MGEFNFLNAIHAIIKKHDDENVQNGFDVSFLQIIGRGHYEVIICNLMAFLLNPKESHRQGNRFLKLFLETINETLKGNDKDEIPVDEEFTVKREEEIENRRRVDIVLISTKRVLPIEVKIDALDQDKQCQDYFEFYKNNYNASQVFYLTINGHKPYIPSSQGDLIVGNNLILLSFRKEILTWLTKCESVCKNASDITPVVKYLINDLKKQIRKFCGLMEDDKMENEILKVVLQNEELALKVHRDMAKLMEVVNKKEEHWRSFCNELCNENANKYRFKQEGADGQNSLTIHLTENIEIDIGELFSSGFIAVKDKKICDTMMNTLKKHDEKFEFADFNGNGRYISKNMQEYFLGVLENKNPVKVYDLLVNHKDVLIQKIGDFVELIYTATNN